ncbi:hypothetical protein CFD26_101326 [Aspergillus turcosus]|uniref:Alcohol dehydrogenase-like C-terminal domain-containing protein n=1 Tax=Aspergillus turcosus TaxID=1245748 RepID=A0A3R7J0W6_9EURO|nr:hypothetical protein CFD26_101326 [Aspergillus turcosus]
MRFAATPPYDGTLATYYCVPAECCYKLPAHLSLRDGALVEPLSVAVHSCRLAGDIQGKQSSSSELVRSACSGATHTYQMTSESPERNAADILRTVALELGADVVLDATGAEPCMNCGILVLGSGGTFVQTSIRLLDSRRIRLEGLVTHEFPFTRAEDAFKHFISRAGIKTVIYGPGVDEHVTKATLL